MVVGRAKRMGELTLQAYARENGLQTASCRYFTVYGPRAKENHAVIALVAKAFVRRDPFAVWGTGEQLRNWTFVGDIVEGTVLAAEKIEDGAPRLTSAPWRGSECWTRSRWSSR